MGPARQRNLRAAYEAGAHAGPGDGVPVVWHPTDGGLRVKGDGVIPRDSLPGLVLDAAAVLQAR